MNNNEKLAKLAVHKSLLKEYSNSSNDRIVYMDDGTEFQIQVFNPYSYVIGVSFSFNDNNSYNSNLLVLRPGERVWLDRYLDKESKLLFSTYEVGNSKAVKEAIKENGKLTVKFYKEKEKQYYNNIYISKPWYPYEYNHIDVYYNTCDVTNNDLKLSDNCDSAIYCDAQINGIATAASTAASTVTSLSTTASYATTSTNDSASTSYCKPRSKSIETGRIEEGGHSNQKFENVYKDFESWPFKTEVIKILPTSQKQINSNDLKKRYCHECGRKLNQKYKFCPFCGAEQ